MSEVITVTQEDWDEAVRLLRKGGSYSRVHMCPVAVASERHFRRPCSVSSTIAVMDDDGFEDLYEIPWDIAGVVSAFDRLYPHVNAAPQDVEAPRFPITGELTPITYDEDYYDDDYYADGPYGDI